MTDFKENDKVRIVPTNSNEEAGIAGRMAIIDRFGENNKLDGLITYYVIVEGDDEQSGEWELPDFELELIA